MILKFFQVQLCAIEVMEHGGDPSPIACFPLKEIPILTSFQFLKSYHLRHLLPLLLLYSSRTFPS